MIDDALKSPSNPCLRHITNILFKMKERSAPPLGCLFILWSVIFLNFSAIGVTAEDVPKATNVGNKCTLCADGNPVQSSFLATAVPFLEPSLGVGATCADWEADVAIASYNETSGDCSAIRRISTICGCVPPQAEEVERCHLCADGQNISASLMGKPVPFIKGWYGGIVPTCQDWDLLLQGIYEEGSAQCMAQRVFSYYCGCSYFNFNVDLWILLSRISGSISLLCSLALIVHISRDRRKRSSIYHQIILGISSCDFISSIFFILADVPAPATPGGDDSFCKAQGFFLQLGFGAMFFNVSLTLYYMLTIAQGWTESRIRRVRVYLLAIPFGLGLVLACAGIPAYVALGQACWLPSIFITELFGASPLHSIFIGVMPICVAIATITLMQVRIFYFVRQSEQKMLKWRFSRRKLDAKGSGNTTISMTEREKKVFWQSALYVCSFYITWPVCLTSLLIKPDRYEEILSVAYKVDSAASFLWPLQGFFTCIIYFRPRIVKSLSNGFNWLRAKTKRKPSNKFSPDTVNPGSSTGDLPVASEEGQG